MRHRENETLKYWVFQDNQVTGPYDPDDLSQRPGYCAETLVCPEGRKGTNMGDWQRAGMLAELSVSLLKASQLAPAAAGGPPSGLFGSLPPEPTLRDLAALGSLQEKVSLMENVISQLQDSLRVKDTDLLSVHRELEDRTARAQELSAKLTQLEQRLVAVTALEASLDKTAAAEHEVESAVQRQSRSIEDLVRAIETIRSELREIDAFKTKETSEVESLKTKVGEVESLRSQLKDLKSAPPAPAPDLERFGPLEPAAAAGLPDLPKTEPAPSLIEPSLGGDALPAFPLGSQAMPEASAAGLSAFPPAELEPSLPPPRAAAEPFAAPAPETPTPAVPMRPAHAVEIEEIAEQPKKGKGKLVLAGLAALLAAGAGLAFKAGLIPGSKSAPQPSPATAPVPELTPKQPGPEEQAEAMKQSAISLVKNWPGSDGTKTVGQILEGENQQTGGLSPWMSDKIKDDSYQVNFFAPKSQGASRTYEFDVHLGDKQVLARNDAAQELLAGKPAAPVAVKKKSRQSARLAASVKGKVSVRPKRNVVQDIDSLLSSGNDKGGTKKAESIDQILSSEAPKKSAAPAEPAPVSQAANPSEEPSAPEEAAAPKAQAAPKAEAPKRQARTKQKKAADAELLDDLLKP